MNPTQYEYSVTKPHFVYNQVDFVKGKPPVLTIYNASSGEAGETINLEKFNIEEVRCVQCLHPMNERSPHDDCRQGVRLAIYTSILVVWLNGKWSAGSR